MGCDRVKLRDGSIFIVCSRGKRRGKAAPCSVCGAPSTRLCDFPLVPPRAPASAVQLGMFDEPAVQRPPAKTPSAKTCDAPLCDRCSRPWSAALVVQPVELSTLHRDEFDLCPTHEAQLRPIPTTKDT
jgi:hypothetical protein